MLRGENIACGTTTTGTGPFTLAALSAGGAVDLYTYLVAALGGGPGFGTNANILIPGTIVEFTDSTFKTVKNLATGILTVNIGASLTATTVTQTSMLVNSNASSPSYNDQSPGSINVGVAANTIISITTSAWMHPALTPFFDATSISTTAFGVAVDHLGIRPAAFASAVMPLTEGTGGEWFTYFPLLKPIFAKRVSVKVTTAGTGTTNAYGRIYQMNSLGRPGKLICDYGVLGTGGSSLNATGYVSSQLQTGVFLPPGEYFFSFYATWGGGSPAISSTSNPPYPSLITASNNAVYTTFASGGASTAADPAETTSYAIGANGQFAISFLIDNA